MFTENILKPLEKAIWPQFWAFVQFRTFFSSSPVTKAKIISIKDEKWNLNIHFYYGNFYVIVYTNFVINSICTNTSWNAMKCFKKKFFFFFVHCFVLLRFNSLLKNCTWFKILCERFGFSPLKKLPKQM